MIPFKVSPCNQTTYKEQMCLRHEGMESSSSWCCPLVTLGKLHLGLCCLRRKGRRESPRASPEHIETEALGTEVAEAGKSAQTRTREGGAREAGLARLSGSE